MAKISREKTVKLAEPVTLESGEIIEEVVITLRKDMTIGETCNVEMKEGYPILYLLKLLNKVVKRKDGAAFPVDWVFTLPTFVAEKLLEDFTEGSNEKDNINPN